MSLVVREGDPADLDVLVDLECATMGADAWAEGAVMGELVGSITLIAEDDGRAVGWAAVSLAAETADLRRITVDHSRRREGIATALLTEAHDRARAGGAERIVLEVRVSNETARAFYEARGYTRLSVRRGYYADGSDAVVLEHGLGEA